MVQALAGQVESAKGTVDQAIGKMIERVMAETGADPETARAVAEETIAAVFNQVIFDVAEQLKSDTNVDEQAAHSLAKMITAKAAAERRSPDEIISLVEGWA